MFGQEKQIQFNQFEKRVDFALHMVEADFDKKEAALKVTPISDALGLIHEH